MTVGDINEFLDAFSVAGGRDEQLPVVHRWCDILTACEQKWLVRALLKDMKTGCKHDMVFKRFGKTSGGSMLAMYVSWATDGRSPSHQVQVDVQFRVVLHAHGARCAGQAVASRHHRGSRVQAHALCE